MRKAQDWGLHRQGSELHRIHSECLATTQLGLCPGPWLVLQFPAGMKFGSKTQASCVGWDSMGILLLTRDLLQFSWLLLPLHFARIGAPSGHHYCSCLQCSAALLTREDPDKAATLSAWRWGGGPSLPRHARRLSYFLVPPCLSYLTPIPTGLLSHLSVQSACLSNISWPSSWNTYWVLYLDHIFGPGKL